MVGVVYSNPTIFDPGAVHRTLPEALVPAEGVPPIAHHKNVPVVSGDMVLAPLRQVTV